MDPHSPRSALTPPQRPRLAIAGPLLRGSGELHIVGRDEVVTILDPAGAVHRLLLLADGSRTAQEILSELALEFPQVAEHDLREAVAELEAAGVLEDVAQVARMRSAGLPRRGAHARAPLGGSFRLV